MSWDAEETWGPDVMARIKEAHSVPAYAPSHVPLPTENGKPEYGYNIFMNVFNLFIHFMKIFFTYTKTGSGAFPTRWKRTQFSLFLSWFYSLLGQCVVFIFRRCAISGVTFFKLHFTRDISADERENKSTFQCFWFNHFKRSQGSISRAYAEPQQNPTYMWLKDLRNQYDIFRQIIKPGVYEKFLP